MRRVLTLALLVAAVAGCNQKQRPTAPAGGASGQKERPAGGATGDSNPAEPTAAALADAKPDFTFTAEDWFAECKKDAGKVKYGGKVIEVTGVVTTVLDTEPSVQPGMALVHLAVKGDSIGVRADCPANAWRTAIPKAPATVRGYYGKSSIFTGELYPCALVQSSGRVKTYKAPDLAKELEADTEKAAKAHDGEWCWVEGVVVGSETNTNGGFSLKVKGAGKTNLSCGIPADIKKRVEAIPVGAPVKVFGELSAFSFGGGSLSMSYTRVE